MGEGYPDDVELMKLISSASIACGYHAGDVDTMRRTVELALANGVAIGAHPGYQDRENFGRRPMALSATAVIKIVREQIAMIQRVCNEFDAALHHVKPHGALYNQAAKDEELAAAIAVAVKDVDDRLILYGLSGSHLISQAELAGLRTASEVFADRTYATDGTLTPRSEANALITNASAAAEQAIRMVADGSVLSTSGEVVPLKAETICIHGDGPHALEFATSIRSALETNKITIRAL